jgi:hypothetical protein
MALSFWGKRGINKRVAKDRVLKETNVGYTGDAEMDSILANEGARRTGFAGVQARPTNPLDAIAGFFKRGKKK